MADLVRLSQVSRFCRIVRVDFTQRDDWSDESRAELRALYGDSPTEQAAFDAIIRRGFGILPQLVCLNISTFCEDMGLRKRDLGNVLVLSAVIAFFRQNVRRIHFGDDVPVAVQEHLLRELGGLDSKLILASLHMSCSAPLINYLNSPLFSFLNKLTLRSPCREASSSFQHLSQALPSALRNMNSLRKLELEVLTPEIWDSLDTELWTLTVLSCAKYQSPAKIGRKVLRRLHSLTVGGLDASMWIINDVAPVLEELSLVTPTWAKEFSSDICIPNSVRRLNIFWSEAHICSRALPRDANYDFVTRLSGRDLIEELRLGAPPTPGKASARALAAAEAQMVSVILKFKGLRKLALSGPVNLGAVLLGVQREAHAFLGQLRGLSLSTDNRGRPLLGPGMDAGDLFFDATRAKHLKSLELLFPARLLPTGPQLVQLLHGATKEEDRASRTLTLRLRLPRDTKTDLAHFRLKGEQTPLLEMIDEQFGWSYVVPSWDTASSILTVEITVDLDV